jgi:hypothetical protein
MQQNARDLAHAGIYLCCLAAIFAFVILATAAAVREAPKSALFEWAHFDREALEENQRTRVSEAIKNAREIRAALATPVPGPSPLPPITAQVAYGHLKPGGKTQVIARDQRRRLPKAALEAFAMDGMFSNSNANRPVSPEMHRVY